MKRSNTIVCVILAAMAAACGAAPANGGGGDTQNPSQPQSPPTTVDAVIGNAGTMPIPPSSGVTQTGPSAPEAQPETFSDGSTWQCTTTPYSLEQDPEQFVTLDPNAAVIWPGSLLQGNTVESGSPEPIALQRGGGTIVMNLLNSGKGTQANSYQVQLNEITQGNVIDAQNKILSNNVGGTPAAFSFESEKVDSTDQLALAMGLNVGWMGGDVQAALSFSTDSHYTRYLVKLTQQYYTMVFQTPDSPSSMFDPSVTADDVSKYVGPGNPATYISSVTYGRQFYLLMESTASEQDMEAALKATYDGSFVNADASFQATFKQTEEQTTIKAYAVGGAADTALQAVVEASSGRFEALNQYLSQGGTFGADNPGVPISYVVRNAADNTEVRVALAGQYSTKQCYPIVQPNGSLVLWLDANDLASQNPGIQGGSLFYGWKGKSQASNNGSGQAVYESNGMNGHPTASFSNQPGDPPTYMNVDLGSGYTVGNDYTVVSVVSLYSSGGANGAMFLHGTGNTQDTDLHVGWITPGLLRFGQYTDDVDADATAQTGGDVVTVRQSQSTGKWLFMDGQMRAADTNATHPLTSNVGAQLGGTWSAGGNFTFDGEIGEVRVYNYALKDSERLAVECELGQKWGIGVANCVNGVPDPTKVTY